MKRNPFHNPLTVLAMVIILAMPAFASADTPSTPTTVNTLDNGQLAVVNVAPVGLIVANVANTPVDTANSMLGNPLNQVTEAANATNESVVVNNANAVPCSSNQATSSAVDNVPNSGADQLFQWNTNGGGTNVVILMQKDGGHLAGIAEENNNAPSDRTPFERRARNSAGNDGSTVTTQ